MLIVAEYLHPSTRNHLPLHEIGHRVGLSGARPKSVSYQRRLLSASVTRTTAKTCSIDIFPPFDRPSKGQTCQSGATHRTGIAVVLAPPGGKSAGVVGDLAHLRQSHAVARRVAEPESMPYGI